MNTNEEMLQFLYKNASMSADTTKRVMDKTRDKRLKNELASQIMGYRRFAGEATDGLRSHGLMPQDNSVMTKLMTNMGIEMNTMIDSTSSHIAELMINGTNMGIIKMHKHLNRNKSCDENTTEMCNRLLKFEKDNITSLERYLR